MGPFELLRPLASGGMGQVWRGTHRPTGLPVAVKVLPAGRTGPRFAEAVAREVRVVAGLDHPHIVVIVDQGTLSPTAAAASEGRVAAGSPAFVMELAAGTLEDWLADRYPSWADVRQVLLQVLMALAHAHARGVVHLDLKPANVLRFDGDGSARWKLSDFGIARRVDEDQGTRRRVSGTPGYMAPEQMAGRTRLTGPWTDLYAVGCLAWRLLTGRTGVPDPSIFRREGIPAALGAWLAALTRRAPAARFPFAADAAHALTALGDVVLERQLREVARGGRPRCVVVGGTAGVGKSRIAQWICERAHEVGAARALVAFHGPTTSVAQGLVAMCARHLRTSGLDRPDVAAHLGLSLPQLSDRRVGVLTELLSPLPEGAPVHGVTPATVRTMAQRLAAFQVALEQVAADRPAVLWLDDAHWGEESLALSQHLLELGRPPVLIVVTVRTEALADRPAEARALAGLVSTPGVTEIALTSRDEAERKDLVRGLLGLNDEAAERVADRAGGNPLFATQLVADWVDRGVLEVQPDGFGLPPGVHLPLPDAIADLWAGRLETALSGFRQEARTALEFAALLGVEVDDALWAEACGCSSHHGVRTPFLRSIDTRYPHTFIWLWGEAQDVARIDGFSPTGARPERAGASLPPALGWRLGPLHEEGLRRP
ncbi:MAG: hypothetical protein ACI8PZ_005218 [Myxococcota bacterium]|jgi:hypothetical protein